MTMFNWLQRIRREQTGAAAIEFALIGPAMLVMMFGVLQVGVGMQAYNAMRSASADVARYAAVQSQKSIAQTNVTLQEYAQTVLTSREYRTTSGTVVATVVEVASPRVAGTREFNLQYTYTVLNTMELIGIDDLTLSYTRPIFIAGT